MDFVTVMNSEEKWVVENGHTDDHLSMHLMVTFPNGYQASIVRGQYTYGGDEGLFEIAVMLDGEIVYDTSVTDDVIGWLNDKDVIDVCKRIAALPPRATA